ncbi:MAG: hypothetical protein LBE82_11425 [Chitinophagaceae bacterium]|jgi:hypothetical protein|nr:hypothetical protein [Chitinophagaceae bacterium]
MKAIFLSIKQICGVAIVAIVAFASCKKYDSLGFTPGTGAPTIASVHTVYRTDSTTVFDTITVYHSDGTSVDSATNNQKPFALVGKDSVVTEGLLGNSYIIYGTNLGSASAVYFNGISVYFNRAFMTDQSIIVTIPTTVPYLKPAATDTLRIVTEHGAVSYYFPILIPAPTINTVNGITDYNFRAGSLDTLYGVGFDGATDIFVKGITTSPSSAGIMTKGTIVSQTANMLIVQFPKTSLTQGNLVFAYTGNGGVIDTSISSVVFNNVDNNYQLFTDDLQNGWFIDGWASDKAIDNTVFKTGTASFRCTLPAASWWFAGFSNNSTPLAYDPSYQYLSFWVLGGVQDEQIYLNWGNMPQGQYQTNRFTIKAGVWQFFKIPIPTLNWNSGSTPWSANSSTPLGTVWWFMTNQYNNAAQEVFYFDDVMLIK